MNLAFLDKRYSPHEDGTRPDSDNHGLSGNCNIGAPDRRRPGWPCCGHCGSGRGHRDN